MASTLQDVAEFLDDLVSDLTGMHVKAAQWRNAPSDQDAVDALAKLPAGLIDRAQELRARIGEDDSDTGDTGDGRHGGDGREAAKPKPKAKAPAAKPTAKR